MTASGVIGKPVCVSSLLLGLLLSSASAAENLALAAAKDLHREAAKSQQLWTCLQLEAWGQRQQPPLKLGPILRGNSKFFGDPLLATPHPIIGYWDHGGMVGLLTEIPGGARYHLCAADGRPLALPVALPFAPDLHHASADGRFLGLARLRGSRAQQTAELAIIDLTSGKTVLSGSLTLDPIPETALAEGTYDTPRGFHLADDGSAAGLAVSFNTGGKSRLLVLGRNNDKIEKLDDLSRLEGVGPGASYLVCSPPGDSDPHVLLGTEMGPKLPRKWFLHGATLVFRQDTALMVIDSASPARPLSLPVPLGEGWNVEDYGRWLAVSSGEIDRWCAEGDFLPSAPAVPPGASGGQQVHLLAWDTIRDPAVPPAHRLPCTTLTRAQAEAQALLSWDGQRLDLIDVSGEVPLVRTLAELPAQIVKADSSSHHYRVELVDGTRAIIDPGGALLWHGAAAQIGVHTRHYALIDDGENANPRFRVVHLDRDPARRKEVVPQLPGGNWWIDLDHRGYGIARRGVEAWHRFSLADGALEKTVLADPVEGLVERAPGTSNEENRQGRFYRHGHSAARLFSKVEGHQRRLDQGPQHYQDALPTGRGTTLLLLADAGRLWLQSAPDKPADLLGQAERGDHFRTSDKGRLLGIADDDAHLVHAVAAGPKLGEALPGREKGQSPDDLGWRFDHKEGRFTIPGRGREQAWTTAAVGFQPNHFQGYSKLQLLAITPSGVLLLDTGMLSGLAKDAQ